MALPIWLPFTIAGGVLLLIIILNIAIVAFYGSTKQRSLFPSFTVVLSLTISMLTLLLIPVDIYSVSNEMFRNDTSVHDVIRGIYSVLYCAILGFCFLLAPFAYFFYEEYDPDKPNSRVVRAGGYTAGFVVIVLTFIVVGLFLRSPFTFDGNDPPDIWAKKLIGEGGLIGLLSFFIGCVTVLGYVVWISYTAYGLSSLSLGLIKGTKSAEEEGLDIGNQIQKNKSRLREDSYLLENENRKLEKRLHRVRRANQGFNRLKIVLRPFSVLFGVIFFILSLLIAVSITLTLIDRLLNHIGCGVACGFILSHPGIFNPLDQALVWLSRFFPLDYVVLLVVVIYLYLCTLNGIVNWGIRLCCFKLYSFKQARTAPQGLLIGSIFLMLSLLTLNNQILTLAPTYTMFGSQTILVDNKTMPCSLNYYNVSTNDCVMTEIGNIVHLISLKSPLLGIIFFGLSSLFVLIWLIGIFVAGCRAKSSNIEHYSSDEDWSE